MQLEARIAGYELRPFGLGFLHAILAEHPLTRFDHRLDRIGRKRLADGDERHRGRIARSLSAGGLDLMPHFGERYRRIAGIAPHKCLSGGSHRLRMPFHRVLVPDARNFSNCSDWILTGRTQIWRAGGRNFHVAPESKSGSDPSAGKARPEHSSPGTRTGRARDRTVAV